MIDVHSTRRAEIEAAIAERGLGTSVDSPKLTDRAALMTRAAKRDIGSGEFHQSWQGQVADLRFPTDEVAATARKEEREAASPDLFSGASWNAADAAFWAVEYLKSKAARVGGVRGRPRWPFQNRSRRGGWPYPR